MTTEYAGQGDADRTLELLWGLAEPPSRGPKPRLSVPAIVRAAIEIADTEGLAQLSMRKVADRLGVGATSLYTYVPGKHELIDVMLDTVIGEVPRPGGEGDWRARLARMARDDWALYTRHPWILHIAGHRPVMGPNTLAAAGSALGILAGLGLPEDEVITMIDFVDGYVRGMARDAADAAQAEQRTGQTDEQWWASQIPLWHKHFDVTARPDLPDPARVAAVAGAHERKFEFGLQRILDGIAGYLAGRGLTSS
ncbi:TetR/AcrR family transcriptional regulator [Crossiella sp. NPDC003009]